ncbi:MAG: nicotinate phosphoribosyltransferase [Chitinophagaceae bacterium]|nr:nicotinate phosphoribosyltransferase [Chitinophagaceae bacterium]MCW5913072.1 nicotinate phosphoribosyltransferase [Chitinophagaceae bacterium]MCZ2396869.1 nicotinate phosphoribosyltransferase [Chitinophagales bacterium]
MNIKSILDNDFYKFTMQNAVVTLYPRAKARYAFINRGGHEFPEGFAEKLRTEIKKMEKMQLTPEEKIFLRKSCPYLPPTYLDFLQGFRYDADEVTVAQEGGNLEIKIEGFWYRTILWEVPLMFLVCELYYEQEEIKNTIGIRQPNDQVIDTARKKIEKYKSMGIKIADFGTRRRHSYEVQKMVVNTMITHGKGCFTGTSNVHLAMELGTRPIGTHAHEWFMFHAARYGFKMSNPLALENWVNIYRGDLGIALSDTYTTDVFFRAFDKKFSKLFDGVRHDSGDPIEFAQKTITHYKSMGIDPLSKTIIFSDALNYEKVRRIADFCNEKIGMSFGIGTNFTNDVGLPPLNIVIKMTETHPENGEWNHVVKLSDEHGKYTGNPDTIQLAKTILGI